MSHKLSQESEGEAQLPGGSGIQRKSSTTSTTHMLPKRRVYVNIPLPESELDQNGESKTIYASNKIRTAKYTLLTFLPKNLLEQFRRVANMYFLFLVILQAFPSVGGDVEPVLSAVPLLSIISITALKDAFEDWKRRSQDNSLNRSKILHLDNWHNVNIPRGEDTRWKYLKRRWNGLLVWLGCRRVDNREQRSNPTNINQSAEWRECRWQDLRVGDLVKLKNNESVPADMIILSTSEPDGLCYIETKNLDGETNLKVRHSVSTTSSIVTEKDCENATFYVESEPPHPNLYSYTGALHHFTDNMGDDLTEKIDPISINDVLLRGCVLRNTEWVIGLVVFAGTETKIMLNSGDTPSKRSRIEIETNFHVTMNFIIVFCLCLGSSIADSIYYVLPTTAMVFEYSGNESAPKNAFLTFWTYLIIFQNIVPISLYVTIEIVKTVQAYFIYSDIDMYYEKFDYPCTPKTWSISDDLGQIEYIFSDKTGTLTQNVMEFRKCTINGVSYGLGDTDVTRGAKLQGSNSSGDNDQEKQLMFEEMNKLFDNRYVSSNITFVDPKLFYDLRLENQQSRAIQDFFSALALCHTALSERPDESDPYRVDYKAQSPDEVALVGVARDVGFAFIDRYQDTLTIEVMGERKEFTLLNVLEFNSTRKRMSVIVRPPEGGLVLLCKGADSVIYERLKEGNQSKLKEDTLNDLETFASEGLRTLCIAYRVIPDEEYNIWSQKYAEAASSISEREEKIEAVYEMIEHSLVLMGGTAIEDRLQEGVPECIATLAQAGIKLWVLTGDKTETAINIGFACNLLQKDMQLIIVNASNKQSAEHQLREALNKFFGTNSKTTHKHALVIDGETLKYALDNTLKGILLGVGKRCQSVVCCRVSPLQKAQIVEMVKTGLNVMTLSIGDGANDVSMIQEANVGIGIAGEEGRQAVMASDYAFAQFRYLTKLLLVHGRWSYLRVAEMITCFFYKNIVWTIAMFWFQFYTSFSAQYLYDYTFIMLYNVVFTAVPVMYLGAFDQDVDAETSLRNPPLYKRGILQRDFTKSKFWLYVLDAIYQSAVCFFIPYGFMQFGSSRTDGLSNGGLQDLGTLVAGTVVVTTNLYVGLNTLNWTWLAFFVTGFSILSFYAWAEFYSLISATGFFRVDQILYSEFEFWLTIALAVILSIFPRFVVKYLHKTYWPIDTDIVREQVYNTRQVKKSKKRSKVDEDQVPIASGKIDELLNTSGITSIQPDYAASDVSVSEINSTAPAPSHSLPKLRELKSRHPRTTSIRSEDQLFYMGTGKRQSFTGFAFSGDESGFEAFRQSIYRPAQPRPSVDHTQSMATSPRKSSFLSHLSISRTRTLPSILFSRRSISSRDPSPSRLNNLSASGSERSDTGGRWKDIKPEEVELSVISYIESSEK